MDHSARKAQGLATADGTEIKLDLTCAAGGPVGPESKASPSMPRTLKDKQKYRDSGVRLPTSLIVW